jgi:hypothetical protein
VIIWRRVRYGHVTQGLAWPGSSPAFQRPWQVIRGLMIVIGVVPAALAANLVSLVVEVGRDPSLEALYLFQLGVTAAIAAFAGRRRRGRREHPAPRNRI